MDFKAKLDHGGIEIEVAGQDPEKVREELLKTAEFLDTNKGIFGTADEPDPMQKLESPEPENGEDHPSEPNQEDNKYHQEQPVEEHSQLSPLSKKLGVPESELEEYFIVEESQEPLLYLPDEKILGTQKTDRQRRASLILLFLWEYCFDKNRVKSTELKNALMMSGIDESKMSNMYQGAGDRYFDRGGRGPSATVGLTGPGRRQAYKVIENLLARLREDNEESEDSNSGSNSLLDY